MRVEELLSKKNIAFQQKGSDYILSCLNPEHDDGNPSMRVDRITGIYHCFSCGFKGNLFTYFNAKPNAGQIRRELLKKKINQKLVESVGMLRPSDAEDYEGDWRGISGKTYKAFGAFQSALPEFASRIVFPINDISGRTVAFIARHTNLMHNPKYLISPKEAKIPLYPVVTPIEGKVILVEGIFDALNLHDKGLTNTVCTFGTRTLTLEKLEILKVQGIEGVDIFFDADDAGQSAAIKVKELCDKLDLSYRNIELKQNDPGSLSEATVLNLKRKLYG
jgi:DNA primase